MLNNTIEIKIQEDSINKNVDYIKVNLYDSNKETIASIHVERVFDVIADIIDKPEIITPQLHEIINSFAGVDDYESERYRHLNKILHFKNFDFDQKIYFFHINKIKSHKDLNNEELKVFLTRTISQLTKTLPFEEWLFVSNPNDKKDLKQLQSIGFELTSKNQNGSIIALSPKNLLQNNLKTSKSKKLN